MPWQDHFNRDDLIARIRRLAEQHDLSQTQVADVIGHDMTGNMVRGLANRAKPKIVFGKARADARQQRISADKPKPSKRTREDDSKSRLKPAITVVAPKASRFGFVILDEVDDFSQPGPVHFNDFRSAGGLKTDTEPCISDGRCRFPLWPDRMGTQHRAESYELMFCGKPVVPGTSWCPDCTSVVFLPEKSRTKPGEGRKVNADGRRTGWQYGT